MAASEIKVCSKRKEEGGIKKGLMDFLNLRELASLKANRYVQRQC